MGYESPMPVQEEVIPFLLGDDNDVIALAQTGTGKTAAFGLPILQKIDVTTYHPQALVLCPTRELCIQIADDLNDYSKYIDNLKVLPVYGGSSIESQIKTLKRGVHVVVATPGRLLDLMNRKTVDLSLVKNVIMDEADEMLNIAGIEASFVLFPEAGQAYLSARSGSNVNVQVISEMLGGGGNATTAGAQFPGKTTEDVLPLLKETIDNYFDDET